MAIDRDTLLFFDSSCLIAAAGSPNGGSGFLLSVCARGFLRGAISQPVLLEAERNVVDNFGGDAVTRYDRLITATRFDVIPVPSSEKLQRAEQIVGSKDAHVLAAAQAGEASFLITLDKRLAERINTADLSVTSLSPGGFITTMLITHSDYPSMR